MVLKITGFTISMKGRLCPNSSQHTKPEYFPGAELGNMTIRNVWLHEDLSESFEENGLLLLLLLGNFNPGS